VNKSANISGSLRNRLVVTLIAGVAFLSFLLYFAVRDYAAKIALQSQDSILFASVISILDTATLQRGEVELDIPYSSFSMLNTATDDRIFYAIFQDDQLLSGYENLSIPTMDGDTESNYQSTRFLNIQVRQVTTSRVMVGADVQTKVIATIAQTQDSLSGTLREISKTAAVYGAVFFVLAVLLSLWAASTAIRPLKILANSIAKRGPQDLSPVTKRVPSEMAPLVLSFNKLMMRLEKSFSQSEEFIAEAAHRIRTPLSTVRSRAEATLQRVEKEENRQAVRSMIRAIDESSRASTQILDHAMITFRANQLECHLIDLVELVSEVVRRQRPVANMKHIDLSLSGESSVRIEGDPILIQNAISNIIDNALKYSPTESNVNINVEATPSPRVEVSDQGSGFPEDQLDSVTTRFARGRNAEGTIGSGLGLTIATDIANAHGGMLNIENRPQGGACVIFSL
jgi:two-component system sensor histidine kinase TctE